MKGKKKLSNETQFCNKTYEEIVSHCKQGTEYVRRQVGREGANGMQTNMKSRKYKSTKESGYGLNTGLGMHTILYRMKKAMIIRRGNVGARTIHQVCGSVHI